MKLLLATAVIAAQALALHAQNQLTIPAHMSESISSFRQLVHMSQLIIDGTVISSLPAISPDSNKPDGVETDSLVLVNEALYGKAAAGAQIVLLEGGGKCRSATAPNPQQHFRRPTTASREHEVSRVRMLRKPRASGTRDGSAA
jgi:hypothetical protein